MNADGAIRVRSIDGRYARSVAEMISVVSSNLRAVGYDATTGELVVTFRTGSTYRYRGVTQATYARLLFAESKGHFLSTEIKGRYPYTRVA